MPGTTIDIDTGGTFTDAYVVHDGAATTVKVLTTPHDFALCFAQVVERAAEALGLGVDELLQGTECVRYATTVGTNAVIQRTGPRVGLLLDADAAATFVEGDAGRAALEHFADEQLVAAVDPAQDGAGVVSAAKALLGHAARGLVCSMPAADGGLAAERAVMRDFHDHHPRQCLDAVPLTLSHEIATDPDDVRRTATALFNAYVHEDVARYLHRAEDWLRDHGYTRPLLIVHNDGGCARVAKTVAGRTYNSGPTAGLLGAEHVARVCAIDHLVTFDVGGTSLDVGFLAGGRAPFLEHGRVGAVELSFAMPDVHVLGAGGGSIAEVRDGAMEVGPRSAGATPGPACFATGGTEPTVTDADVVLGIIDPGAFLGGRLALDVAAARRAMEPAARELGVEVDAVAARIRSRLHERMAARIADELAQRGLDPAATTLLAYGGGGPTHACDVAARLGVREVLTLPFAAVFSAFGASSADVRHTYVEPDGPEVEDRLRRQAFRDMRGEGFGADEVDVAVEHVDRDGTPCVAVTATARLEHPALREQAVTEHTPAPAAVRPVTWPGAGVLETPVHQAAELRPGATVAGPAVVEADDTTVVVPAGWTHHVDALGIGRLTHTDQEAR
ncbi:hydantoinase/oxoprolinase family protein [Conexibacter sp. SYSU D00693]|uniref:hydantoinase/oxoprolinase family protein n=1 Tax=Conexibacter sp. SYSU D00693 TaxID=2812560 RepID=UPI00196B7A91|nr:hydantoinase/oxoprolinase family protein [Conexibacter sp. SYSU D00693]